MKEKTVELKFTLTRENAVSAVRLSGEQKERFERNRNTTICFAIIIVLFAINLVTAFTGENNEQNKVLIVSSIVFIALSLILIAVTWIGGRKIIKSSIDNACDGTEYHVFINKNGISYIYGNNDEQVLERGHFTIKSNDEIYLLTVEKQKLVIPKACIPEEDRELTREYLL